MKIKGAISLALSTFIAMTSALVAFGDESNLTKVKVPYSDDIYIVSNPDGERVGHPNTGTQYLEDNNSNRLTGDYMYITPLSAKNGLYQVSIPAGHSDCWQGVIRLTDDGVVTYQEPGMDWYHCIEKDDMAIYFSIYNREYGKPLDYYDVNGELIENLGVYAKANGISLERSDWAEDAVKYAWDGNFMPPTIGYNYRKIITRKEFCTLAVMLADRGKTEIKNCTSPYTDVDDYYVSLASAYGIVSGVGDGKFEPDRAITRQEAAVLLCNLADYIGNSYDTEQRSRFNDDSSIAPWAKESVYKICGTKSETGTYVMEGVGSNSFSPLTGYTREQAIVTVYRLAYQN